MHIGQVVGNIVSTKKDERLMGSRFLVVNLLEKNQQGRMTETGQQLVAVDSIGAGRGEYVLITTGSSARLAVSQPETPVDATIIGIIDEFIE